jgi:hypothetical protein
MSAVRNERSILSLETSAMAVEMLCERFKAIEGGLDATYADC